MAGDKEIKVVISAVDDYSAALNKFNAAFNGISRHAESATSSIKSHFDSLKSHWLGVTAAITAAIFSVKKAWDFMEEGARFEGQRVALNRLAQEYGQTADSMIASTKRAAGETVSALESVSIASKGLLIGMNPEQVNIFTDASKRLSDVLGIETTEAFDKLTTATVREKAQLLKLLGVNVELESSHGKVAHAAHGADIASENYSRTAEALSQTLRRLGPDVEEMDDKMGRFKATLSDVATNFKLAAAEAANFVVSGQLPGQAPGAFGKDQAEKLKKQLEETSKVMGLPHHMQVISPDQVMTAAGKDYLASIKRRSSDEFMRGLAEIGRKEDDFWAERDKKLAELREKQREDESSKLDKEREKRSKDDKEFQDRLFNQRITAAARLAEMEKRSPYGYQKGEGGEIGDAFAEFGMKLAALRDYNTQRLQLMVEAGASQYQIEQEYERLTTEMKRKEQSYRLTAASQTFGAMSNMMQNLYIATGKNNRGMFEAMKALAIAQSVIDGIVAVQAAYKWGQSLGGPPLGAIFAAAAIAATAARVRQIADTKPEGATASISAGGTANPDYAGGAPSAYPVPQRYEQDVRPAQNITFIIQSLDPSSVNWQKLFADNIKPAMEAVSGDGNMPLNIRVVQG